MMEHLLLIGTGGNQLDIIQQNYGGQVKTRIICRSTTIRMLLQNNQNEMIIGLQEPIIVKPIDGTTSIGVCQISEPELIATALEQRANADILISSGIMAEEMLKEYEGGLSL